MAAQGHQQVFNEWRGNLHITGQAAAGSKTTKYTDQVGFFSCLCV